MEFILHFLCFINDVWPYVILVYLPFRHCLKMKPTHLIICLIAAVIGSDIFSTSEIMMLNLGYEASFVLNIAITLSWCIFYFKSIKADFGKKLFVLCIAAHLAMFICGPMNSFAYAVLFPEYDNTVNMVVPDRTYFLCCLAQYIIALPIPFALFATKITALVETVHHKRIWGYLWLMPAGFTVSIAVEFFSRGNDVMDNASCFAFFGVAILVYVLISQMIVDANRTNELESQLIIANNQLDVQKQTYAQITENMDNIRKARHDLRHHLVAIEGYAERNEIDSLQQYLKRYKNSLPLDERIVCENQVANNIIQYYLTIMKPMHIKTDFSVDLREKCGIADLDICVVLGNCLENAVEACERIPEENRYIKVMAKQINGMFSIVFENSFDGKTITSDGVIFSRKKEKRIGVGLSSVSAVVERYDGIFKAESNGNIYTVSVFMNTIADAT